MRNRNLEALFTWVVETGMPTENTVSMHRMKLYADTWHHIISMSKSSLPVQATRGEDPRLGYERKKAIHEALFLGARRLLFDS
nr:hypothetical protein [Tanacetum cinerariifolium]